MIQVQGLSKCYGHTKAVDDLSFEVRPGRVTGFLGPNGSGKSTTMRIVLGLDAPDAGRALVNGRPYRDLPWPLREVGAHLDAKAFHPGRSIHDALGGDPNLLRAKRRHEPESDFLWGEHTIIELDEFQHFSTPRLRSLDFYVGFPVGFSVARYRRLCNEHQARADKYRITKKATDFPVPESRTAQRAYLDAVRDLLGPAMGYRVVRIPAPDEDANLAVQELVAAVEAAG